MSYSRHTQQLPTNRPQTRQRSHILPLLSRVEHEARVLLPGDSPIAPVCTPRTSPLFAIGSSLPFFVPSCSLFPLPVVCRDGAPLPPCFLLTLSLIVEAVQSAVTLAFAMLLLDASQVFSLSDFMRWGKEQGRGRLDEVVLNSLPPLTNSSSTADYKKTTHKPLGYCSRRPKRPQSSL